MYNFVFKKKNSFAVKFKEKFAKKEKYSAVNIPFTITLQPFGY